MTYLLYYNHQLTSATQPWNGVATPHLVVISGYSVYSQLRFMSRDHILSLQILNLRAALVLAIRDPSRSGI